MAERSSTMPYVTDDDSKAVKRIAEIERELQEAKAEFDQSGRTDRTGTRRQGADRPDPGVDRRLGVAAGPGRRGVARRGAEVGQGVAPEDEGLRLSSGHGAVSGGGGGGTDRPPLVGAG